MYDVRHTITSYKSITIPDLHYWDTVFKLQENLTSLKELSIETTFIGEKLSPSLWRCSFPSLEVLKLKTLLPKIQSLHLNIWHYRFNGDFPGIIQELNGLNYPVRYLKVRTDSLYILSNLFPTTKLLDLDVEESVTYIPSDWRDVDNLLYPSLYEVRVNHLLGLSSDKELKELFSDLLSRSSLYQLKAFVSYTCNTQIMFLSSLPSRTS